MVCARAACVFLVGRSTSLADREVQRILLELLNQMDGFDISVNVKVIMATNRADTLDPALLRPGRLDRKIEFPLPDRRQKRLVFSTITSQMNLHDEVDLEDYVARPDKISGADISAICQEAGMLAVRKNRYVILNKDFEQGWQSCHVHALLLTCCCAFFLVNAVARPFSHASYLPPPRPVFPHPPACFCSLQKRNHKGRRRDAVLPLDTR